MPAIKAQTDGTLIKSLARAWRWQGLLDRGDYSIRGIAEKEEINASYVSRILRLALLAPDIVEGVLEGRSEQVIMLEQLERPLPADWAEQRRALLDADRGSAAEDSRTIPAGGS